MNINTAILYMYFQWYTQGTAARLILMNDGSGYIKLYDEYLAEWTTVEQGCRVLRKKIERGGKC